MTMYHPDEYTPEDLDAIVRYEEGQAQKEAARNHAAASPNWDRGYIGASRRDTVLKEPLSDYMLATPRLHTPRTFPPEPDIYPIFDFDLDTSEVLETDGETEQRGELR